MFCITIGDLRSMAFIAGELNNFPRTSDKDRYRWKEMELWVNKTTTTTKSEAATS